MNDIERRKAKRITVNRVATLRSAVSSQSVMANIRNISQTGLCLAADTAFDGSDGNEEFYMAILDPRTKEWLPESKASIVWQKVEKASGTESSFISGMKFDEKSLEGWGKTIQSMLVIDWTSGLSEREIAKAYDGSTSTFQVLRAFGWGPLANLGYYKFPAHFTFLEMVLTFLTFQLNNQLPEAQQRLVLKTLNEVEIQEGDRVLDLACGRGRSSFIAASKNPRSEIVGVDLLEENIRTALTLYGGLRNLKYLVGNAMDLQFLSTSFDKIYCLEAAFHFPDRLRFLTEAHRILKPGGKLVIVDFMWKNEKSRANTVNVMTDLVKDIWKFEDFSTIDEYLSAAESSQFHVKEVKSWSRWVTTPAVFLFKAIAQVGNSVAGRYVLERLNPLAGALDKQTWRDFMESAAAHVFIEKEVQYTSLSLVKMEPDE